MLMQGLIDGFNYYGVSGCTKISYLMRDLSMKILITGGAGFIGSAVSRRLIERKHPA